MAAISSIKSEYLVKAIAVLLGALGILILVEVVFPFQSAQIIPHGVVIHFATGFTLWHRRGGW
jgi:hypothetical protein